jgi:hypothetical protein
MPQGFEGLRASTGHMQSLSNAKEADAALATGRDSISAECNTSSVASSAAT